MMKVVIVEERNISEGSRQTLVGGEMEGHMCVCEIL